MLLSESIVKVLIATPFITPFEAKAKRNVFARKRPINDGRKTKGLRPQGREHQSGRVGEAVRAAVHRRGDCVVLLRQRAHHRTSKGTTSVCRSNGTRQG